MSNEEKIFKELNFFKVSAAIFQSELNNLQNSQKYVKNMSKMTLLGRFFELYSIMTEK